MATVYRPNKAEDVRRLSTNKEDREKHLQEFRDEKEYQQKIKEERFAAIRKRQNQNSGGSGGINISVESEKR